MRCPSCMALTPDDCRLDSETGCDHPVALDESRAGMAALLNGSLLREHREQFRRWLRAAGIKVTEAG